MYQDRASLVGPQHSANAHSEGAPKTHSAIRYIRQAELIGTPEVTVQQAQANRLAGKGPVRPRPARPGIVPFSAATLWRRVKDKTFVAPCKLGGRVTAWDLRLVLEWLEEAGRSK